MAESQTPPAIALIVLYFFAGQPDFPAVLGDLKEEFHQRVRSSSLKDARRWFWREAFRNVWALSGRELLQTPIRTTLMALISIIAISACTALYAFFRLRSPEDFVYVPQYYTALLLLNFIPSLVVGRIGALLLPGREWALALTYTLISFGISLIGAWYLLFVLKVYISPIGPIMAATMMPSVLRQGSFWLGALGMRALRCKTYSRLNAIG